MKQDWSLHDYDDEETEEALFQAARLYDDMVSGGSLQSVATSIMLTADESAYADDDQVEYSRYYGHDWYTHVRSGSYLYPSLNPREILDTMITNRISRKRAEALA